MASVSSLVRALAFVAFLTAALAVGPGYVAVEQLKNAPDGWIQGPAAPPSKLVKFHTAVSQENADELEQKVLDISTPGHDNYGQHMKRDEVREFAKPSDHIIERVLSWLDSANIPGESIKSHGNWVEATMRVSQAELLMNTKFYLYTHRESHKHTIRTLNYSVPRVLSPDIQTIQPTTHFGQAAAEVMRPTFEPMPATFDELTDNCTTIVTPDCLREQYGLYDTTAEPDPRNRLGISGYLNQYARHEDFKHFMRTYAPNRTDTNITVVSINGGLNLQNSSLTSVEASLDVQYAVSLAYDSLTTFYTTAGRAPFVPEVGQSKDDESLNEPYLEQLHGLLNLPDEKLPAILTTSYGEYEQTVPRAYSLAACNLFAQLGARGVSVIFSSGDSGVGGSCLTNDEKNKTRFQPIFPASCPFVTSVGGTSGSHPETAVDFSGGGFSDRFRRPSYQDASVTKYLEKLGGRWKGMYNRQGRGIPDVAAQAQNYLIIDHGEKIRIGGTRYVALSAVCSYAHDFSASAPVFAAIISRLNAARLKDDKPRLGFLNPWLYSLNQTGFTDIVDGGSVGCQGESGVEVPYASWNATPGWDPATGLGTPFFNTLEKVVRDL